MAKTISVTEYGSNRQLVIVISSIKHVEAITYRDGPTVTVITYLDGNATHVLAPLSNVKAMIDEA